MLYLIVPALAAAALLPRVDGVQPLLYRLEKKLAPIPRAVDEPGRRRLADNPVPAGSAAAVDHGAWDRVLKRHVTEGGRVNGISDCTVVDYAGIAADPDFDAYLAVLAGVDLSRLSPAEDLALWMNAYNALCINHIVTCVRAGQPEPESILGLKKGGTPIWDQEAGVVGGKPYSLNQVEHDQLRKRWNEPMVHACIVCASASCPNLRREAFVADRLAAQMADQFSAWMANPTKGICLEGAGAGRRKLTLSRILLWFADDFGGLEASRAYVKAHATRAEEDEVSALDAADTAIRYFTYDWGINSCSRN